MNWVYIKSELPNCVGLKSCLTKTDLDQILILCYNSISKEWMYPESNIQYSDNDYGKISCWAPLSELDDELTDNNKCWAYNFNEAFLDCAIPALDRWINTGVSYPYDTNIDEWRNNLRSIYNTFSEYRNFYNNQYDLTKEDRLNKQKEIANRIKDAFKFIGDHFDDMWD